MFDVDGGVSSRSAYFTHILIIDAQIEIQPLVISVQKIWLREIRPSFFYSYLHLDRGRNNVIDHLDEKVVVALSLSFNYVVPYTFVLITGRYRQQKKASVTGKPCLTHSLLLACRLRAHYHLSRGRSTARSACVPTRKYIKTTTAVHQDKYFPPGKRRRGGNAWQLLYNRWWTGKGFSNKNMSVMFTS